MYNLQAELAENLKVYEEFFENRSAVEYPQKMDTPMVWDTYMDTQPPVGQTLDTPSYPQADDGPIEFSVQEFGDGEGFPGFSQAGGAQDDALALMNDRLKTQARRYPHPITNEMEGLH